MNEGLEMSRTIWKDQVGQRMLSGISSDQWCVVTQAGHRLCKDHRLLSGQQQRKVRTGTLLIVLWKTNCKKFFRPSYYRQ